MKTLTFISSFALFIAPAFAAEPTSAQRSTEMVKSIEHINPKGMNSNPAFSQAVKVKSGTDLLFIGGQNSTDAQGKVVGVGDVKVQTVQSLNNLQTVLESEGLKLSNVVKWNIHVVQGHSVKDGFEAFQQSWDKRSSPPAITVTVVSGLANPEFLVEIDAVAAY